MVLTTNVDELENTWMKLYLNLNALKSRHPKAKAILSEFQDKLALFQCEVMVKFFDSLREAI